MTNIMIDLETLGISPSSAILSIGAVAFDDSAKPIGEFYRVIDLQSCLDAGLEINGATFYWWLYQDREARDALRKDRQPLAEVLLDFSAWVYGFNTIGKINPWGNGADFDIPIIVSAYKALGYKVPWLYYSSRCYRTWKNLNKGIAKPKRMGTYHNALDDARFQVAHMAAGAIPSAPKPGLKVVI